MLQTEPRTPSNDPDEEIRPTPWWAIAGAWLLVSAPLAYGLWETILKAINLFGG
ncbi:MAG TPA: hypothetical protein VFC82_11990 [Actinomycetaceae bacterium]|nr:hypothetical protein [Actinomycetaceae bacterium]